MLLFLAFISYTLIVFFIGAVFGMETSEVRIVRDIQRHGSFRIKPHIYIAEQRNYRDSYDKQARLLCRPPTDVHILKNQQGKQTDESN